MVAFIDGPRSVEGESEGGVVAGAQLCDRNRAVPSANLKLGAERDAPIWPTRERCVPL